MTKREAELKSKFYKELRLQLPTFQVLWLATAGAPDRCIVGNRHTSFLEFKHADPEFTSHGNQELMCRRLARQGFCRYVIWYERSGWKQTFIVHPDHLHPIVPEEQTHGFDHKWLVNYVKRIHKV